ncbi:hypothetical protein C8R45DRAFT_1178662 [Mycena sanguinolenta]|nr:hypothetical protein C8R45DRAFT_1178662 [Mycena sanguinolenta]
MCLVIMFHRAWRWVLFSCAVAFTIIIGPMALSPIIFAAVDYFTQVVPAQKKLRSLITGDTPVSGFYGPGSWWAWLITLGMTHTHSLLAAEPEEWDYDLIAASGYIIAAAVDLTSKAKTIGRLGNGPCESPLLPALLCAERAVSIGTGSSLFTIATAGWVGGSVAATSDLGVRSRLGVTDLSPVESSRVGRLEAGGVVQPKNAIGSRIKICDMVDLTESTSNPSRLSKSRLDFLSRGNTRLGGASGRRRIAIATISLVFCLVAASFAPTAHRAIFPPDRDFRCRFPDGSNLKREDVDIFFVVVAEALGVVIPFVVPGMYRSRYYWLVVGTIGTVLALVALVNGKTSWAGVVVAGALLLPLLIVAFLVLRMTKNDQKYEVPFIILKIFDKFWQFLMKVLNGFLPLFHFPHFETIRIGEANNIQVIYNIQDNVYYMKTDPPSKPCWWSCVKAPDQVSSQQCPELTHSFTNRCWQTRRWDLARGHMEMLLGYNSDSGMREEMFAECLKKILSTYRPTAGEATGYDDRLHERQGMLHRKNEEAVQAKLVRPRCYPYTDVTCTPAKSVSVATKQGKT